MTKSSDTTALLLVLGAVVSVQFGGAFAATLIPVIGAAGTVLLRLLFGALLLLVLARPRLRGHRRGDWVHVVALGVSIGVMNLLFYQSLARIPIGVAVTVEFIGPLLLSTVLARRAIDYAAIVAAALGVVLISQVLTRSWAEISWVGLAFALGAGVAWAVYILASARTGAAFPGLDGLAIGMLIALVVIAPLGVTSLPRWTWAAAAVGLLVALMSSVIPYSLEMLALRRLDARIFGVLLSLEPAVAALAGLLVLGQRLAPPQVLGMALVVLASALISGRRRATPSVVGD
ncbi:EamA family transporter [Kribbia dieselivorans]|uniref:EamA family transporter n=1 Tax=Kribbia dieselivorans TaxID=331526 RepID=UPI000A8467C4|nr:EamA family transporter [Kribbia dieselivorans]